MSTAARWTIGILGVVVFLMACGGFAIPAEILIYTIGGWVLFLKRTLPNVQVNWPDVALAVAALTAFLFGSHWFLKWLVTSVANRSQQPRSWSLARSMAVCSMTLTAFLAGTAVVGLVHQSIWLATSEEELLEAFRAEGHRRNSALNNLKQLGLGVHNRYDMQKSMPAGATRDEHGVALHGWQMQLLPFVEEVALYNRIDKKAAWNTGVNADHFRQPISAFQIPRSNREKRSDSSFAPSDYASNQLVIGPQPPMTFKDIPDGTSKTFLAGEVREQVKPWGSTTNWRDPRLGLNKSPNGFGGPWKSGGTQMLIVDGSARYISADVDPRIIEAFSTPAGGEDTSKFDADW